MPAPMSLSQLSGACGSEQETLLLVATPTIDTATMRPYKAAPLSTAISSRSMAPARRLPNPTSSPATAGNTNMKTSPGTAGTTPDAMRKMSSPTQSAMPRAAPVGQSQNSKE